MWTPNVKTLQDVGTAPWENQGEDQSQECPKEWRTSEFRVIERSVAWGPVRSHVKPTSYDRELARNADALVITECCGKERLCFFLSARKLALQAWFCPSKRKSEIDEMFFLIAFHLDIPFLLDPFPEPHDSCCISGVLTAVRLAVHIDKRKIQTVSFKYKWAIGMSKQPFQKSISWKMGLYPRFLACVLLVKIARQRYWIKM